MPANQNEINPVMSNPAKILLAFMRATNKWDSRELAAEFDIPLRTIQRWKMECATSANDAISGVYSVSQQNASRASDAMDGAPVTPQAPDMALAQELHSCAGATKELPSVVSSYLEVKEEKYMSEPSVSDPCVEDTLKAKRRFSYTREFETFWKSYPDITNNSKPKAFKEWRSLTSAEQHNAADGIRHLAAHCKANPTYRCVHACRYLSERRWESYPTAADRLGGKVVPISTYKPMPQPAQGMSREALEKWALELEASHG